MKTAIKKTLSEEEKLCVMNKIIFLLSEQTRAYTCGDSSSIKSETAAQLLESVLYVLGIDESLSNEAAEKLVSADIKDEFRKGLQRIENKCKCAKELYRRVSGSLPEAENISMLETVSNIGLFWKSYDYRLFAAEIPCSIDYQLAVPVSESLKGVDYLSRYLESLYCENRFMSFYDKEICVSVLNRFCPDYKGLLINLFEPVAADSIALEILGKDPFSLNITDNDREKLELLFCGSSRDEILSFLTRGAERLAKKQNITAKKYTDYLFVYAKELSERIYLLKDRGGLAGIFP